MLQGSFIERRKLAVVGAEKAADAQKADECPQRFWFLTPKARIPAREACHGAYGRVDEHPALAIGDDASWTSSRPEQSDHSIGRGNREAIEAARRITDKECAKLKTLHKDALRQAKAGDSDAYIRADLAWHEAVWRVTKNSFLETALQRAVIPLFGFSYIQFAAADSFDLAGDAKTHAPLLAALCEKNPQRVEQEFEKAVEVWMDYALELTN